MQMHPIQEIGTDQNMQHMNSEMQLEGNTKNILMHKGVSMSRYI